MSDNAGQPKAEVLRRLERIAQGLVESGYHPAAEALSKAVAGLRRTVPKRATIQEVTLRALESVIRNEATVDGRLIDGLAHVAKSYGVVLSMHPALLVAIAVGGQGNPDRADPQKSALLDDVLAVLVEDPEPYQETLHTLAILARNVGLDETADLAVELLHDIHDQGAETMAAQATAIEKAQLDRPNTDDDNLGWIVKTVLTLTTLALIAASAVKLSGALSELIGALDDVLALGEGGGS